MLHGSRPPALPAAALLALLAGCAGFESGKGSDQALVSGWEYRLEPSGAQGSVGATGAEAPGAPPPADPAGWQPLAEIGTAEHASERDTWLRAPIPVDAPRPAVLVLRAYVPVFAIYLDGSRIYSFRSDSHGAPPARSPTYHTVPLPLARPTASDAERLELWAPGTRFALLFARSPFRTSPRLCSPERLSSVLSAYVGAPLREELDSIVLGILTVALGLLQLALSLARWRRPNWLLFSSGLFSLLYGLRMLAATHLILLVVSPLSSLLLVSLITYWILVPAWSAVLLLFGRGWRATLLWGLPLVVAVAIGETLSDLLRQLPFTGVPFPNNLVVLLAGGTVTANLIHLRRHLDADQRLIAIGAAGFGLLAVNDNLVGLRLLPWTVNVESWGYLFFVGCLGYIAARRFFVNERQLAALEAELETARQIQAGILPRRMPELEGIETTT